MPYADVDVPAIYHNRQFSQEFQGVVDKGPLQGVLGAGVFNTDDCQGTYDDLKAKGVQFISPPTERPYGIEAVFRDDSGNCFSLMQRGR